MDHSLYNLAGAAYNAGAGLHSTIDAHTVHLDYSREEVIRGCTEFTLEDRDGRSIVTYGVYNRDPASAESLIASGELDITEDSTLTAGRRISQQTWTHLGSPLQAEMELKWADTPSMRALSEVTQNLRDAGQSVQLRMSTLDEDGVDTEVVVTSSVPSVATDDARELAWTAQFITDHDVDRVNVTMTPSDPSELPYEGGMDADQLTAFVNDRVLVADHTDQTGTSSTTGSSTVGQNNPVEFTPSATLFPHSIDENMSTTSDGAAASGDNSVAQSASPEVGNGPGL